MQSLKIKKEQNEVIQVFRKDAFDNGFEQYFKDLRSNKVSKVLNDSERKVKLSSVTYRQMNSWEEQDLLTIKRKDRGWRRFSIMEALWLKIISELREFGFPIEKIKVTKESLRFVNKKCGVEMPFLEFFTAFAIGSKMPVMLLVFRDGIAIPVSYTQYKATKEVKGVENHIQINLNEILQSFFPAVELKPTFEMQMAITLEEMELLAFMRVKKYEKVEVFYKGGKIDVIEGFGRKDVTQQLNEIFREHKYQKVEVSLDGGKIVSVKQRVKHKVEN